MRLLIVDDERIAREGLRRLVAEEPDVDIVGEASDGAGAVRAIREHRPDVVMLDVRMPRGDGFQVLEALRETEVPAVVFVTAYDEHAVRAFEVNAVDYLLKPFTPERMRRALRRARRRISSGERTALDAGVRDLVGTPLRPGSPASERIVVRSRGRIRFVSAEDVSLVEAAGDYVTLHAGGRTHLVRSTLSDMEERLAPHGFVRIGRSHLVNADRTVELRPLGDGRYRIVLDDGSEAESSRRYRDRVEAAFGIGR